MRPKKAKELIPVVAKQLSVPESLVEDLTAYYWQEVKRSLTSLADPQIHITNLGNFTIKHWKIDEKIESYERFEEMNKQKGLQQMTARFKTAERVYDLKKVKELVEAEKQRKEFIKLHKTTENESKNISDMEEQGVDNGGDKE